jgi:site-specific DNA-methyltransferase (adenine-specific)
MIAARCFQIATDRGDIVLDPFGGGGSSYEAAQVLGRYWIGTEITDCQPIADRLTVRFPGTAERQPPKKLLAVFR